MPRIYQGWATGRELRFSSRLSYRPPRLSFHRCSCRHLAIERGDSTDCLVWPTYARLSYDGARHFTQNLRTNNSSQSARAVQEEETVTLEDVEKEHHNTHGGTSNHVLNSTVDTSKPNSGSDTAAYPSHEATQSHFDPIVEIGGMEQTFSKAKDPSSISKNEDTLDDDNNEVDGRHFATSSGFWSLLKHEEIQETSADTTSTAPRITTSTIQSQASPESLGDTDSPKVPSFDDLWKGHSARSKIDLSFWDAVKGERYDTYATQQKQLDSSGNTRFRANKGERNIVLHFLRKIYPHISSTYGISDEAAQVLFDDPKFAVMSKDHDVLLNNLTWSWILLAPPDRSIKRLHSVCDMNLTKTMPKIPLWLVMQLLRSTRYSPQDFVNLIRFISQNAHRWQWNGGDPMILTARLLRHARYSNPGSFSGLVDLFFVLLRERFSATPNIAALQSRTHWCNRLLTLLALSSPTYPFRYVEVQQNAQLLLLQSMQDAEPEIQLNREGYRALAKVQLMHKKTTSEKEWTKVQSETWPPWEKEHQMGVESTSRVLPGNTSRTNKVFFRMREDGYSPHASDVAAQILAGRDSDGSPTLQVRRAPSNTTFPRPWLPGPESETRGTTPKIWASRIEATRTIREAWMGFCAYEDSNRQTQSYMVYLAMFNKLFAKTVRASPDDGPLPGDGIENFPEPKLARDHIYVPEEVPQPHELYARMIANDVKPKGQLLDTLLRHERYLSRGLAYLEATEVTPLGKALTNPMIHSPTTVARALRGRLLSFTRSYIKLIARPHVPRDGQIPKFLVGSAYPLLTGPYFAARLLCDPKLSQGPVWGEYFAALRLHGEEAESDNSKMDFEDIWRLMGDMLAGKMLDQAFVPPKPDNVLLHTVLKAAFSIQTWTKLANTILRHDPLETSMRCFLELVTGTRPKWIEGDEEQWCRFLANQCTEKVLLHAIPSADVVQDMALLMVAAQRKSTISDIIALLRWTLLYATEISTISTITRRNLAAFRVYLEGHWMTRYPEFADLNHGTVVASQSQIDEAKLICDQLGGWASDEDVEKYLMSSEVLFTRIKNRLKAEHQM